MFLLGTTDISKMQKTESKNSKVYYFHACIYSECKVSVFYGLFVGFCNRMYACSGSEIPLVLLKFSKCGSGIGILRRSPSDWKFCMFSSWNSMALPVSEASAVWARCPERSRRGGRVRMPYGMKHKKQILYSYICYLWSLNWNSKNTTKT